MFLVFLGCCWNLWKHKILCKIGTISSYLLWSQCVLVLQHLVISGHKSDAIDITSMLWHDLGMLTLQETLKVSKPSILAATEMSKQAL
jgi:hypothetical protein